MHPPAGTDSAHDPPRVNALALLRAGGLLGSPGRAGSAPRYGAEISPAIPCELPGAVEAEG